MEKIQIRSATKSDLYDVSDFLVHNFYCDSPLDLAHPDKSEEKRDVVANDIIGAVMNDSVLISIDSATGILVGALIAEPVDSGYAEFCRTIANGLEDQKGADILNLFAYIEEKATICESFKVDQSFYLRIVSVHRNYRRKHIGKRLLEAGIGLAKARGYKLAHIDCVSVYSSKMAESLGMELILSVTYDEYNDHLGTKLFVPIPPHLEIKTFVKRL